MSAVLTLRLKVNSACPVNQVEDALVKLRRGQGYVGSHWGCASTVPRRRASPDISRHVFNTRDLRQHASLRKG